MDGGCGCGQIRYAIAASQPPVVYACHCTDCQTQSGSAFALQMPVFEAMLSTTGQLVSGERTLPSGAVGTIYACAKCLVRIYSKNSTRKGMLTIRAGTLDNSKKLVPKFHLWVRSKQPWIAIPKGALALDGQPASTEEWMRLLTE
ncbi:MAG: GFA family protein [Sphingomonadaceae bacterium]|nr:GFA family protein [Sphingomonadaceae bacterium]